MGTADHYEPEWSEPGFIDSYKLKMQVPPSTALHFDVTITEHDVTLYSLGNHKSSGRAGLDLWFDIRLDCFVFVFFVLFFAHHIWVEFRSLLTFLKLIVCPSPLSTSIPRGVLL